MSPPRHYQLVFIWPKDPPTFADYARRVTSVVEAHDGRLDRQIVPTTFYGEGLAQPAIINLVSNPSAAQFDAFHRDPRFLEVVPMRARSIDMAAADGDAERVEAGTGDPHARHYLVELAAFGPGGEAAYRAYEAEAEPVMARYGYHVECVFRPRVAKGFPFVPDLVKVAYFEQADGMARMHGDPAHARIEQELYPQAVRTSIWAMGTSSRP